MKTNIYLHIGTPKTGTSAIQKALLENCKLLKEHGFIYPLHDLDPNGISSGNGAYLIHLMKTGQKKQAKELLHTLLKESEGKTLILSSENFYRHPELTYELMPDAKILVYIREQSDQIRADYNQSVKRHYQIHFFDKALHAALARKDRFFTFELLDTWRSLYGVSNMNVRLYDIEEFYGKNIIYDFMNQFSIKEGIIFTDQNRVNISYHEDALRFKLWFNRLVKGKEKNMKKVHNTIDYVLQSYSAELANTEKTIQYRTYTDQQLYKVKTFYRNYNQKIAETFFPDRGKPLFADTVYTEIPKPYPGLTRKKIIEIGHYIERQAPDSFLVLQNLVRENSMSSEKMKVEAAKKLSPLASLSSNKVKKEKYCATIIKTT